MKEYNLVRMRVVEVYLAILVLICLINSYQHPKFTVASIFAIVYIIFIYIKFRENFTVVQLCSLLLFGVINSNLYLDLFGSSIYGFYIVIALYYISLFIKLIKNNYISKHKYVLKSLDFIFIIFIIAYAMFSVIISENKSVAIVSIKSHIVSMALFIIAFIEFRELNNVKKVLYFLKFLLIGILFLGFMEILGIRYGMANHFESSNLSIKKYPHIKRVPVVFFFNPNNYCVFLVGSMCVLLGNIIYDNKKIDSIDSIIYFFCLVNLIFGMSRTAWITLVSTLIFGSIFLLMGKKKKYFKKIITVLFATLVIFYSVSYIPQMKPFYGKVKELKEMNEMEGDIGGIKVGKEGSINIRTTLIVDVTQGIIKDKHVLGFGPGNTSLYIKKLDNTYGIYNLHSLVLEVVGDYGIIVFLIFVIAYIKKSINLFRKYFSTESYYDKKYIFISGLLMFSLILLSFAPSTVMNFPAFWFLLGIAMAVGSINKLSI